MSWHDRLFDRALGFAYWPWNHVKGRHWAIKLAAITLGWAWVLPIMVIVVFPAMLITIPLTLWETLDT